ncbi:XRE family transcriptional regulator [Paenarthrobacter sp. NPDC092416]|uniref:XRE family transcriptional regulator n=1 Tax=Paenarthrobacter sp. NPDC092416 TaxID=3364386 RepID=UPI003801CC60
MSCGIQDQCTAGHAGGLGLALAREAHISQNRVSQIERGNIEHTQIDTLRKYIEALGGTVEISARFGSERFDLVS